MAANISDRLREHPAKRFAAPVRTVDLGEALESLRAEPHEGTDGHRQITIVHDNDLSMVLFQFEANGCLPQHDIEGQVTLHVLEGALDVQTNSQSETLQAQQLIVIGPNNSFALRASEPTTMLMTVRLTREELREGL